MKDPAWEGELCFGDLLLAYRGRSGDNRPHAHAAVQLVCASAPLTLVDAGGRRHEGGGWLLRSGVSHALQPADRLTLLLLEPQAALTRALLARLSADPLLRLSDDWVQCILACELAQLPQALATLAGMETAAALPLDRRLQSALATLQAPPGRQAVARAADAAGFSTARLRALSQAHFGVPFAKLVLWRKARLACAALRAGEAPAAAAQAGGFVDQAHFTRTLVEVIGLTPGLTGGVD